MSFGKLGALGKGFGKLGGLAGAGDLATVGLSTNYSKGSYSAYNGMFGATGLTPVTDYNAVWTLKPSTFPNGSRLDWTVPNGAVPGGSVWGFLHLDRGNYQGNVQQVPTPVYQVCNLTTLLTTFDWGYTGGTFNHLSEVWLTQEARPQGYAGPYTSYLGEIGFFLHGGLAYHTSGTLIGTHVNNGVTYTVYDHGVYKTIAPAADVLVGAEDFVSLFKFLIDNSVITGSEWVSGMSFGIEPNATAPGAGRNAGVVLINAYDVAIAGSTGPATADYLGTNLYANPDTFTAWDATGLATSTAATDMSGGSTAFVRLETTGAASNHSIGNAGMGYQTVPSRECDLFIFEDFKPDKGRDGVQAFVSSSSFADQYVANFDVTNMLHYEASKLNGLTLVQRQIIDLGNGWRRCILILRKAAGISSMFVGWGYISGAVAATSTTNYVGDITKGMTWRRRNRLALGRALFVSGVPAAAATGIAYSYIPTLRGGQDTIVWSKSGTALPSGFTQNTATGEISGTTASSGTVNGIVLRATGGDGSYAEQTISIAVTASALTTWDATNKDASATLSESNRRMTESVTNAGGKSTSSRSSGKLYFEIEMVVAGASTYGVSNASHPNNTWCGATPNSTGIDAGSGSIFNSANNQGSAGIGTITANGIILGVAIDFTAGKVWFSKAGAFGSGQVPASGTGGFILPTGTLFITAAGGTTTSQRIRTETGQFTYSPPSGFSPWN